MLTCSTVLCCANENIPRTSQMQTCLMFEGYEVQIQWNKGDVVGIIVVKKMTCPLVECSRSNNSLNIILLS